MPKKIYISGALTNSNRKELYEKIGKIVSSLGYNPYIPHMHTDPEKHKDVTPKEVYDTDKAQVQSSCMVIAYVGSPSLGVGAELEMANAINIPIVILYENNVKVSRLVRGIPSVKEEISYSSEEEALKFVAQAISRINP